MVFAPTLAEGALSAFSLMIFEGFCRVAGSTIKGWMSAELEEIAVFEGLMGFFDVLPRASPLFTGRKKS